jgi:hypothetical protein
MMHGTMSELHAASSNDLQHMQATIEKLFLRSRH